jgi:5-methylthioribose kinase
MSKQKSTSPSLTVSQWLAEIEKEYPVELSVKNKYTDEHKKLIVELSAKGYGTRVIVKILKEKFGFGNRETIVKILGEHKAAELQSKI